MSKNELICYISLFVFLLLLAFMIIFSDELSKILTNNQTTIDIKEKHIELKLFTKKCLIAIITFLIICIISYIFNIDVKDIKDLF